MQDQIDIGSDNVVIVEDVIDILNDGTLYTPE